MFTRAVVSLLPLVPKPLVWRLSKRYIAGESLEQALSTVEKLNGLGMRVTLDVLGEDTSKAEQATEGRDLYLKALDEIAKRDLDCNISVKLSQMALRFDSTLCNSVVQSLFDRSCSHGNFLRIDMEDSSVTTDTLDIYRTLREQDRNVGTVIQAYMHRSERDVQQIMAGAEANLRLCKGIYVEPPEVAIQDRQEVRENYKRLLTQMFKGGAWRVGIATHDDELIDDALQQIQDLGIEKDRYEFQMLLGVCERRRDTLVGAGHPMRIYVPFGADWLAYSIRRLRENPQIAMHVIKGFFK